MFDFMLHRQGAAAREEAQATLAAAKLQTEGLRQDLAASQVHLTQTRKELHASQGKVDQLEQQCQDLQDQTHQQMTEIKVCMTAPVLDLVRNWSLRSVTVMSRHGKKILQAELAAQQSCVTHHSPLAAASQGSLLIDLTATVTMQPDAARSQRPQLHIRWPSYSR